MAERPSIICITGPTASGKSSFAMEAARALGGEIVNADSVQVYRGADIGSAKPSKADRNSVPHHLIDCVAPSDDFDAARFRVEAAEIIHRLAARNVVPIISGGTGLYIRSLLGGLVDTPEITEEALDSVSAHESRNEPLYPWLQRVDPYTADSLSPADTSRIRRALLVHLSSGESLRKMQEAHAHSTNDYRALVICLLPQRAELYSAINARVGQMLRDGLVDEVRTLLSQYPPDSKVFGAIGYRQVTEVFNGTLAAEKLEETISRDTRRFAKRQLTWWRHQPALLGWEPRDLVPEEEIASVKVRDRKNIIEGLSEAMKTFLAGDAPFASEAIFFTPVENFPLEGASAADFESLPKK